MEGSFKRSKQKRVLSETSGGAETPSHDDSNISCVEALCRSPVLSESKEHLKTFTDKTALSPEVKSLDNIRTSPKTLERQIQDLPEHPLYSVELSHVHCEFCGHQAVYHNDHIDFICDGELHFVSVSGAVYPHKLAITDTNPAICKLLNFSLDEDQETPIEDIVQVSE
jgi:hypothetical protein